MVRFGSLLMILLLAVPFVRDCCLPVTQPLPCHQQKHADDVTCFSSQQAIPETKTALGAGSFSEYNLPVTVDAQSAIRTQVPRASDKAMLVPPPHSDIYLRTGALLI